MKKLKEIKKLHQIQKEIGICVEDILFYKDEHKKAKKRLKELQKAEITLQQMY